MSREIGGGRGRGRGVSQSMPEVAKVDVGRQVGLARGGERRDGRVVFEGLGRAIDGSAHSQRTGGTVSLDLP